MMDELVKRLRDGVGMQVGDWPVLIHEAADRIEALEARVAAADKLAELCNSFRAVLDSPVGQALAAYEATKDQSDG